MREAGHRFSAGRGRAGDGGVAGRMIMTPWEDLFFVINNLLLGEEPVGSTVTSPAVLDITDIPCHLSSWSNFLSSLTCFICVKSQAKSAKTWWNAV